MLIAHRQLAIIICYNEEMALIITSPLPVEGQTELNIQKKIDVRISAVEAERRCTSWLGNEICMGFMPSTPNFYVDDDGRAFWHIPVNFVTMNVGIIGRLGQVEMDVTTGEIIYGENEVELWYERAEELAKTLPPFKPKGIEDLPPEMIPPPHLRAPVIKLPE